MKEIALTLLLPLAVGMVYLRLLPNTAPVFSKWCIRGSILLPDPVGDTALVSLLIFGLSALMAAAVLVVMRRRLNAD